MEWKWIEENGIIRLSQPLISDGTSGRGWIARLEGKGKRVGERAASVLCSADFVSTCGVEYRVAVLKGSLFLDKERNTTIICAEATNRGLDRSHAELACLICENCTNAEMRAIGLLRIVAMHESITDSTSDSGFLGVSRCCVSVPLLCSCLSRYDGKWLNGYGFAFQETPST